MAAVTHTFVMPDGTTPAMVGVSIRLMADTGSGVSAVYVTSTGDAIEGDTEFTVSGGTWSKTLVANSLISPANTWYRVVERVGRLAYTWDARVVGDGDLSDMLIDPPGSIPTAGSESFTAASIIAHVAADDPHGDRAYADVTFPSFTRYAINVQADRAGFLPIGLDDSTGTVYAVKDAAVAALFRSADPNLAVWRCVHEFTGQANVGQVWVTAAGTILATAGQYLWRSDDDGVTWTQPLQDTNMGATERGFVQYDDGTILLGQYFAPQGVATYTLHLWRSDDDGVTWTVAKSWGDAGNGASNPIRHIHCIKLDPHVQDRVWMAAGDNDWQVFIAYSDDKGTTFTNIGGGDQTWRTVDIVFTSAALFFACDGNSIDEYIIRWDRSTGVRTNVSRKANNSLYYGGLDSQGIITWVSVWEPGTHTHAEANIFCGPSDGTQLIQSALRIPALPEGNRVGMTMYGPDSNDSYYVGVSHGTSGRNVYRLIKIAAIATDAPAQQTTIDNRRSRTVGPTFMQIGPHPNIVGTSQNAAVANRLYMEKFRADCDMIVRQIMYGVGSSATGNVVAGIADMDDAGNAVNILGQSALTAVGLISTPQSVVLATPVALTAGEEYWAFIGFDAATAFRSAAATMSTSLLYRVLNVGSLPPSSPLANQSGSSIMVPFLLRQV